MSAYVFSANGALPILAWATPQDLRVHMERALKARFDAPMNRAFSTDGLDP